MATPAVISFSEALKKADKKPHLLLGNGFSRACRDNIFAYKALFESADFSQLSPAARQAFEALNTTDFEVVMRALKDTSKLLKLYNVGASTRDRLLADAEGLRDVLAKTIAENHPDRPDNVSQSSYEACRRFLCNFRCVYTLNYDLLLYWALMQRELEPIGFQMDDGFRTPDSGKEEYVTWDIEKTDAQSLFYLHGALHIFDADSELKKFTWINTANPLVNQIRQALDSDMFPLIVSEGTSKQKLIRINHSGFLSRAFRSIAHISGTFFVLGHSMGKSDEHILSLVENGKVNQLFVGIFGDPDSKGNRHIIRRAFQMKDARRNREVRLYDARSASVWG